MTPEFLFAALIVILIPGTGVLYTIATAISRGWSASTVAAFGCTLGILPAIAAAFFGLSALLHTGAVAFTIVNAPPAESRWLQVTAKSRIGPPCGGLTLP